MKRLLILCIMLACIVPFVSAEGAIMNGSKLVPLSYSVASGDLSFSAVENAFDGQTATYANFSGYGSIKINYFPNSIITGCRYYYTGSQTYYALGTSPFNRSIYDWDSQSANGWHNSSNTLNYNTTSIYISQDRGGWSMKLSEIDCYGYEGAHINVSADFFTNTTEVAGPAYVSFVDNSTGSPLPTGWNWSYSPTAGVIVSPGDLDNQDIVMLFTQNGDFTITHGVSNGESSDIETKTDYIHVYNNSDVATIRVRAMDVLSGYGINGAQVDVYDIENTSWTNQTSVTGEVTVSLLTGHTFNAYGSATGYDDGEITGLTAVNGGLYPLYMWPTNLPANVTEGNITVYVTLLEDGTNTRLPGFSVSMIQGSGGGPDYTYGVTDSNGVISGVFPNNTNVMISIAPQKGHLGATKSINTGTAVGGGDEFVETTIWLQKATVTPTATLTTGPGGTIPVTEDPYPCDADHPENCKRKQADIANILIQYGDMLVLFFIALTIIGGVKMIGK